MDKLLAFLNHERYQIVSTVLCLGLLIWFWGCESQVRSLVDSKIKINRDELTAEVDFFLASAEIRFKDLDRQDEFKQYVLDQALLYGQTGTLNPVGIVATLAGILGVGAIADNVRKRKVIKDNVTAYVDETKKNT